MAELLDPTTEAATQPIAYVPRPDSLRGKRVALIENTKFNSDNLLVKIGNILIDDYGAASRALQRPRSGWGPAV